MEINIFTLHHVSNMFIHDIALHFKFVLHFFDNIEHVDHKYSILFELLKFRMINLI